MKKKSMYPQSLSNQDLIQLQQMVIHLKAELSKYKGKLDEYQNNYHYSMIDNLKKETKKLRGDRERAEVMLRTTEEEFQKKRHILEKEVSSYKEKISTDESVIQELKKELALLEKRIEEYQGVEQKLNVALQEAKNTIAGQKRKMDAKQSEVTILDNENQDRKAKLAQLETELKKTLAEKAEIYHKYTVVTKQFDEKLLAADEENMKLINEVNVLTRLLNQSKKENKELQKIEDEFQKLKYKYDESKESVLKAEERAKSMEGKVAQLEQKRSEADQLLKEEKRRSDQLQEELEKLKNVHTEQLRKYQEELEAHQKQVASQSETIDRLNAELNETKEHLDYYRSILEVNIALSEQFSQLEDQLYQLLTDEFEMDEEAKPEKSQIIEELENKLKLLAEQIENIEGLSEE